MSGGELPDVGAFGAAFTDFVRRMADAAERPEPELRARLREFLGVEPRELPATAVEFPTTDHPNLQLAVDAVLGDADVVGLSMQYMGIAGVTMSDLLAGQGRGGQIVPGPVQYTDVEVGDGRVIACITTGLFLGEHGGERFALLLARDVAHGMTPPQLRLEGIAPSRGTVSALLRDLRAAMNEHNVFRGKVISLHLREDRSIAVSFPAVRKVERDAVILPEGTLERLERHAVSIAERAEELRAGGRHLKRGILLHGPPGTGKTLSISYLLGATTGRTTIVLTGHSLGLIPQALALARELVPATVIFEDVDLVASERTMPVAARGSLIDLLNQMEGLDEDADLLFLLTTNRADLIEPALAARPGRVDLALEIPLPDGPARRRLIRLYAQGIELSGADEDDLATRMEGVSGAFVKELMRQAALRAGLDGREQPTAADVRAALDELLDDRSALTRRLLGQPGEGSPPGTPETPPHPAMLHALGAAGLPVR